MQQPRPTLMLTRLVAYTVLVYGLFLVAGSLVHELRIHHGPHFDVLLVSAPQIIGLGFIYLGSLLLRRKYNAWLAAILLFGLSFVLDIVHVMVSPDRDDSTLLLRLILPVLIILLLWLSRAAFQVRSDVRSFTQAVRISIVVLLVAFIYGVGGFTLLDRRDFHREINLPAAMHATIDQFGLTTDHPVARTRRARVFVDSLSVISVASIGYAAISLFDPIKMRLVNQFAQREKVEMLLRDYPSDIDDFFKLWPHDKLYFFDKTETAGMAYHVSRGVVLVAGNPFGNPKRFKPLIKEFLELCFVNDWLPAFIHVSDQYQKLYASFDFELQKIGEEAVLDLTTWTAVQTGKKGKYFREIRNRFTKLGYQVEIIEPPHSQAVLSRLREISDQWLQKPGREERGFMLGYHDDAYFQQAPLALVRDDAQQIQGFINLIPTYRRGTANYDLLRCAERAPGNCNDFLLMGLLDYLLAQGVTTLNLGLSPLAGLDDLTDSEDKTLVDSALRFVYSNGDRFYSFSGLHRFKDKYQPNWQDRFIAYPGGIRNFTRTLAALNRAMKIK